MIVDGEVVDGLQLGDAFEDAAPDAFSGDLGGKKRSTMLSQEADVSGEMDVEARVAT